MEQGSDGNIHLHTNGVSSLEHPARRRSADLSKRRNESEEKVRKALANMSNGGIVPYPNNATTQGATPAVQQPQQQLQHHHHHQQQQQQQPSSPPHQPQSAPEQQRRQLQPTKIMSPKRRVSFEDELRQKAQYNNDSNHTTKEDRPQLKKKKSTKKSRKKKRKKSKSNGSSHNEEDDTDVDDLGPSPSDDTNNNSNTSYQAAPSSNTFPPPIGGSLQEGFIFDERAFANLSVANLETVLPLNRQQQQQQQQIDQLLAQPAPPPPPTMHHNSYQQQPPPQQQQQHQPQQQLQRPDRFLFPAPPSIRSNIGDEMFQAYHPSQQQELSPPPPSLQQQQQQPNFYVYPAPPSIQSDEATEDMMEFQNKTTTATTTIAAATTNVGDELRRQQQLKQQQQQEQLRQKEQLKQQEQLRRQQQQLKQQQLLKQQLLQQQQQLLQQQRQPLIQQRQAQQQPSSQQSFPFSAPSHYQPQQSPHQLFSAETANQQQPQQKPQQRHALSSSMPPLQTVSLRADKSFGIESRQSSLSNQSLPVLNDYVVDNDDILLSPTVRELKLLRRQRELQEQLRLHLAMEEQQLNLERSQRIENDAFDEDDQYVPKQQQQQKLDVSPSRRPRPQRQAGSSTDSSEYVTVDDSSVEEFRTPAFPQPEELRSSSDEEQKKKKNSNNGKRPSNGQQQPKRTAEKHNYEQLSNRVPQLQSPRERRLQQRQLQLQQYQQQRRHSGQSLNSSEHSNGSNKGERLRSIPPDLLDIAAEKYSRSSSSTSRAGSGSNDDDNSNVGDAPAAPVITTHDHLLSELALVNSAVLTTAHSGATTSSLEHSATFSDSPLLLLDMLDSQNQMSDAEDLPINPTFRHTRSARRLKEIITSSNSVGSLPSRSVSYQPPPTRFFSDASLDPPMADTHNHPETDGEDLERAPPPPGGASVSSAGNKVRGIDKTKRTKSAPNLALKESWGNQGFGRKDSFGKQFVVSSSSSASASASVGASEKTNEDFLVVNRQNMVNQAISDDYGRDISIGGDAKKINEGPDLGPATRPGAYFVRREPVSESEESKLVANPESDDDDGGGGDSPQQSNTRRSSAPVLGSFAATSAIAEAKASGMVSKSDHLPQEQKKSGKRAEPTSAAAAHQQKAPSPILSEESIPQGFEPLKVDEKGNITDDNQSLPSAYVVGEYTGSIGDFSSETFEYDVPLIQAQFPSAKTRTQKVFALVLFLLVVSGVAIAVGIVVSRRATEPEDQLVDSQSRSSLPTSVPSVAPSPSPTFSPEDVFDAIAFRVPNSEYAMRLEGSPQNRAYNWLISSGNSGVLSDRMRFFQQYALATLYYSTSGEEWLSNNGWLDVELHECDWFTSSTDVSPCDPQSRFQHLILTRNQLRGTLPDDIVLLSDLVSLDLSDNYISRTIPEVLSGLTFLGHMSFSANEFTGSIPQSLGRLTGMTTLNLYLNELHGTIPVELTGLTALQTLSLSANRLSGEIPVELSTLSTLVSLKLDLNELEGHWPAEMVQLPNLLYFDVSDNSFSGTTIPTEFGLLGRLKNVGMSNCGLQGTLPSELGLLTYLEHLDLSENRLNGTLSTEFGTMTRLSWLDASDNGLSGPLPSELGQVTALQFIDLSSNEFIGSIPKEFANLRSYQSKFDFRGNLLSGTVPQNFCDAVCCAKGAIHVDEWVTSCDGRCTGCDDIFARGGPKLRMLR